MEHLIVSLVLGMALAGLESYERQIDKGLRGEPIEKWIHHSARSSALDLLEIHEVGAFLRHTHLEAT
jgi:hypothetical protein